MSVAEEIKSRLDIIQYIGQYAPLKKAGRYYKACCPFHNEKTPSFVVNPDSQSWRCFGACADGGDIFNFAMKRNGWSFTEALQELGRQAGIEVQQRSPAERQRDSHLDQLRGLLLNTAEVYHQHLLNTKDAAAAKVLQYAREKRGLSDETISRFLIGYAPPGWQNMLEYLTQLGYDADQIVEAGLAKRGDNGRVYDTFRNRLMIPIRDERGRVVGFGARALDADDNPKYLNSAQSPIFDKSRLLFGLDLAKAAIRDSETAVIVEGYMDVVQAHQAGYTNVVAQMGTAMTEAQLKLIAPRYAKKIILALDADAAGQNATRRSLEVARQSLSQDYAGRLSVDMRILQIPGAKDPDDLIRETPEQWEALVSGATPVADYVINTEIAALATDASIQEREAVARRILPMLLASENNLYREENVQKLAMRLRIAEHNLLALAQEQRRIDKAQAPQRTEAKSAPPVDDVPLPPPLDYDALEPPPDVEEEVYASEVGDALAQTSARLRGLVNQTAMESYCLRMLLLYPDWYYALNRKFRELAGENTALMAGPLGDLCADDFSQQNYRAIIQIFKAALAQDEAEPLDFLRRQLDVTMLRELDALLVAEDEGIRQRVRNRHTADMTALWKHHERIVLPAVDLGAELIVCALTLRKQRLKREGDEVRFLQMDTQADDLEAAIQYGQYVNLLRQSQHLINEEQKRLSSF